MYNICETKTFYRSNPWKKNLRDRIEYVVNARKKGRNTVAFIYPAFDSSTFRYRGYNVTETLEYSIYWTGMYFQLSELDKLIAIEESIDILVIIRCMWSPEIETLVNLMHSQNRKVVYDVDDLIYNPKYMPLVIDTLGLESEFEYNFWFAQTSRNYMMASMCDCMITTNDYLAKYLRDDFGVNCYIIKNYLNWLQEGVSDEYFEVKKGLKSTGNFEIGYFSGSPTHLNDLLTIMPEVEQFMANHDDVSMKIVGYMELPQKYDYLVKNGKIRYVPFQTFIGLQHEQATVDLNVVPLVNNFFSNCKSELKYFETAIVGTPTCATPSFTYKTAIKNGDNGYLCEDDEWLPIFEKVYSQKNDKEFQQHIRDIALEEYAGYNQVTTVEKILDSIIDK